LQPAHRGAPGACAQRLHAPGNRAAPRPARRFYQPFEFAAFLAAAHGLPPFDVMLEAKAADLALLRLREDLGRYAPELANVVG
jgi:UV DNA damage endonuclease